MVKNESLQGKEVKFKWKPFTFGNAEALPDLMSLLAIGFSIMGLLMKRRVMAWQALVCVIIGLTNKTSRELDVKQVLSSVMIVVMGLVMAYIGPAAKFYK